MCKPTCDIILTFSTGEVTLIAATVHTHTFLNPHMVEAVNTLSDKPQMTWFLHQLGNLDVWGRVLVGKNSSDKHLVWCQNTCEIFCGKQLVLYKQL